MTIGGAIMIGIAILSGMEERRIRGEKRRIRMERGRSIDDDKLFNVRMGRDDCLTMRDTLSLHVNASVQTIRFHY